MVQASRRKYHYIYKTTCGVTNKFYIGMHSTDNLEDGYVGSGKHLWHSIRKHGKENHSTEIIEYLPSREELKLREAQIINVDMLSEKLCMNIRLGGQGGFEHIPLEQQKLNRSKGGKTCSVNGVLKRATESSHSDESNSKRNNTKLETYGNHFGKKWDGEKHTPESIEKMKLAKIGGGTGESNSQFGSCWIFNESLRKNKKIDKSELDQWLELSWIKGRKMWK